MSLPAADVIVRQLRDAGVRALFGVPGGGSSLDLIDAAHRIGLPFVLTATETAGAISAIAQTEVTGCPGACLTGLGPGAAAVVNGIACAFLDRAPLVVITDSHPASADGSDHQRLDQRALLRPITKLSTAITANSAARTVAEAIACALAHPRGPVHIDCAADQMTIVPQSAAAAQPESRPSAAPRRASSALSTAAGRELFERTRPVLIAGLGARHPSDAVAIRSFLSSRRVPGLVTYKAKGVVPDDDPWFAGVFTNGALEQSILADADLIIAAGLDRVELLPRPWLPQQPVVDIDGDIADGLQRLVRLLPPSDWPDDDIHVRVAAQRARLDTSSGGLSPASVARLAAAAFPDARVTVDAGAHMFPATLLWPIRQPGGFLISNGLSTMGFALPAAIGASWVDRERPVVAVTGDGGLAMCAGELGTLARERLRVVVVVFNDRSMSLIDVKQRQRGFDRVGVGLGDIAWAAVARGFGLEAHTATTAEELERALSGARQRPAPTLIDVRIDPAPYEQMLRIVRG
jgi:acetolactate synthase I/II/III large subunit